MRDRSYARLLALAFALGTASESGAGQGRRDSTATPQPPSAPPGIQDNSFLIEEAYNQDRGVVQHISGFQRDERTGDFTYQFTQEWPLGGIAHQLSYTLPLVRTERAAGVGDIRLNYRYQLVGDGEAAVAVAPRLTAILPTGSARRERGAGALGVEAWLPASVVLSEHVVAHANAGLTLTPHARDAGGARATTRDWTGGGSVVWLARTRFNVLVEALYQRVEEVRGPGVKERQSVETISPGIRWAYDFRSGLQFVPGLAVPLGVGPSHGERSVYAYLSFEHPFSKAARAAARANAAGR